MAAALMEPKALGDTVRSASEGSFDIAIFDRVLRDEIVRAIETRFRRARSQTGNGIGDGGERLRVDLDQPDGILGDGSAECDDKGDRLSDIAKLVMHEHDGVDIETDRRRRQRQRNAIEREMRSKICISENRTNAGQRSRSCDVDLAKPRMGVRAAQESGVQQTGKRDVVGETPCPAQQRLILDALDPLTEEGRRTHRYLPAGSTEDRVIAWFRGLTRLTILERAVQQTLRSEGAFRVRSEIASRVELGGALYRQRSRGERFSRRARRAHELGRLVPRLVGTRAGARKAWA